MDDLTTIDDCASVRSESVGGRSPPPLSPVVSLSNSGSPASPPVLPLLSATHLSHHGQLTPPMYPTCSPSARTPSFLPALYFTHPPPPIHTSDPTANDCKLVDYRGQKIAAFIISGESMLCLPQAFELFLKNLVGGLHTVYTKLKRLGIEPIVCNVEQVRVLRGLGAIQPGVNRCKLLCIKHFDLLYKDCTTARRDRLSSLLHDRFDNQLVYISGSFKKRPGRPPKRPHDILGLPGPMPTVGMTHHISPEALMSLKKSRMDARDFHPFTHLGDNNDLDKSPLLSNGYNPPPKALMAQYMALNGGLPHPALFAHSGLQMPPHPGSWPQPSQPSQQDPFKVSPQPQDNLTRSMVWENCRVSYDEVLKHLERIREDRSRNDRVLGVPERDRENCLERNRSPSPNKTNGYGDSGDVLNLSKSELKDDLSDSCHVGIMSREHSPVDMQDDKDDVLSENDDFDDKIDLSDREDYDFPSRSLHLSSANNNIVSSMNNNNNSLLSAVGNISISKHLTESVSSHSNGSSNGAPINNCVPAGLFSTDDRLPSGLTLNSNLISLGMGFTAQGNSNLSNGNSNSLTVNGIPGDRCGGSEGMMGSVGSPSSASTPGAASTPHPPLSSLENLLGNIQNLLKVAAESVRHEEKQWYREKEHLRTEFLRQKELRERLEKQLQEDEKIKVLYVRKLKREKRARRKLEDQLSDKLKRLSQYEPTNKDNMGIVIRDCFSKESVQSAVAAATAVANAVSAANAAAAIISPNVHSISSPSLSARGIVSCSSDAGGIINTSRLSPKTQKDPMIMDDPQNDSPSSSASLYFNKPMLFNCSV